MGYSPPSGQTVKNLDNGETGAAVYDDVVRRMLELLLLEMQGINEKLERLLAKG